MSTGGTERVTLNDLIQGLQEDLSREYKAVMSYVIFSQKLDKAQYMDIAATLERHAHQELDHALLISRQLDYYGAYPNHQPAEVRVSEDNETMLRLDLEAEDETVRAYDQRVKQAHALGEWALVEVLQGILKQEQDHQIELATALGEPGSQKIREQRKPAQAGVRR
ncbi:ferritin-like domain-containing protein [Nitrolancea hollandica]|uniref:Ferritin Dps family protein n=1 Tax=Nitrolancea hollandica Lb TaxID=1129897 RepID=I4EGM9_9BACT